MLLLGLGECTGVLKGVHAAARFAGAAARQAASRPRGPVVDAVRPAERAGSRRWGSRIKAREKSIEDRLLRAATLERLVCTAAGSEGETRTALRNFVSKTDEEGAVSLLKRPIIPMRWRMTLGCMATTTNSRRSEALSAKATADFARDTAAKPGRRIGSRGHLDERRSRAIHDRGNGTFSGRAALEIRAPSWARSVDFQITLKGSFDAP